MAGGRRREVEDVDTAPTIRRDLRGSKRTSWSTIAEHGAGKSTLIKVLTGVHPLDGGAVTLDGRSVRFGSPLQAQQAGISTVYQEVNLCPNLSVAENIFIGREPTRAGRIRWKRMRKEAAELVDRLGLDIDVTAPLSAYPLAVQQLVAIVRSVGAGDLDGQRSGTKVLVFDEPSSSLDRDEVLELFRLIRQLRDEGVAILFVSHFLDQIYEVCDRMTILRKGADSPAAGRHPSLVSRPVAVSRGRPSAGGRQPSRRTRRPPPGRACASPGHRCRHPSPRARRILVRADSPPVAHPHLPGAPTPASRAPE